MGLEWDEGPEWMTEELRPRTLDKDDIIKDIVTGKVFRVENDCIIIGRAQQEGYGKSVSTVRSTIPGATSPGSPWKDVWIQGTSYQGSPGQLHPPLPQVSSGPPHGREEGATRPADI